jgi:hypothetical protein
VLVDQKIVTNTDHQNACDELPRRKQRGIKNFKFCHSALDAESSPVFWIPASAGMTNSPQAAGNTTRRDSMVILSRRGGTNFAMLIDHS